MLDLDGAVVRQLRVLAMECPNNRQRVANAIEEARVAEGDVLRSGSHLLDHT